MPDQPVLAELSPGELHRTCDPASLPFETTAELPDLQDVIGQPRALRALELGSEVSSPGYNIFVLGVPGSGRTTLSQEYLQRKAAGEAVPDDWCYVNNFDDPRKPKALRLPAGRGLTLREDLRALVAYCEREIARVFESEEYVRERDRLVGDVKKKQEAEFSRLQEAVEQQNFAIVRTSFGFVLVPAVQGKPIKPEELEQLSPEQRAHLEQIQARLGEEVEKTLERVREMEKSAAETLRELNNRTLMFVLTPRIGDLKAKYAGLEQVIAYLETVQADILANFSQFQPADSGGQPSPGGQALPAGIASAAGWSNRYHVNLLVDNSGLQGAPVVVESHPSYQNLLGRIEHEYVLGASRTDFSLIRPGAMHRANGGYLILPARDVLVNPYAWEGLKRVLRDGAIRIVEIGSQLGLVSAATLEPEPIPLEAKVVLVGTPLLYYMLRAYDEDFAKQFKVRAEFATQMERTPESEQEYGLFVKSVVDDNHLPPFDRAAVARVIEHSSRLAEDQGRLSTRFGKIADLVCEAAYWARKEGQAVVSAGAVQRAIDEAIYRQDLLEERIQELIAEGTLMIQTEGRAVGQINALSVMALGDYAFGRPSRVTASTAPGRAGVIDVERQAKLGGPTHTKGVLIISGFLHGRYGQQAPLNLSASLTFEQSYDEVEGDSASAAELYALLSSLADVPLRQDRAVTGSVNQHGQVQAIGGVNEKIEGFFAVCTSKGLTGEQGVIIPASNRRNLMLRAEVVQAVDQGQFHIWPIQTVEQGLALLTGLEMGERQPDGSYPEGSFNHALMARLQEFSRAANKEAREGPGAADQEGEG